jgi:hypothetical protein
VTLDERPVKLTAKQTVVVNDQHRRLMFRLFGHGESKSLRASFASPSRFGSRRLIAKTARGDAEFANS